MTTQYDAPDAFLTEYFGTGQVEKTAEEQGGVTNDDIEMISALQLLEKNAAAQGVDLTQYEPEELVQAAHDLYITKEAAEAPAEENDAEFQEFFELHKFAGKIQAHAFASEMDKIAAGKSEAAKEVGEGVLSRLKGYAGKAKETVSGAERKVSERAGAPFISRKKRDEITMREGKGPLDLGEQGYETPAAARRMAAEKGDKALTEEAVKRGRIALGVGGGTLATAGTVGGIAATRGKKDGKKAQGSDSATEQLIEQRMAEMLYDAGYMDNAGNIAPPPVEKSAADEVLEAIDQEALDRLIAAGYR